MNRGDVEFTVSLNTSPAEQQMERLGQRLRDAPFASTIFNTPMRNSGWDNMTYPSQNNYGVPSTQVLERSLSVTMNSLNRFAMAVEMISTRLVNFQLIGVPHTSSSTIYSQRNIAGYLPSSTTSNPRPWFPTEHYTREQTNSINHRISHNDIFNELLYRRKERPFSETYDIFNSIHSPMGARGMYSVWNSMFGRKSPLLIDAPVNTDTSADGIDTPTEQGKDIVEQEKKDNDELKEKLLLWGKISATIYAIRKVISGLTKLWKFGAETATGVNANLREEGGFFSIDPEGALKANSDKSRALMYAGIRNMGANAPVSKSGLDYASSKMTEMWSAAMSGRNVDARTTIDAQRLKDFFGIDVTVAGLLTGERQGKTATDIQIDMMKKVEAQMEKLAGADDVTKGQVIDSLKNILGDELVDAIVENANRNLKIDDSNLRMSLADRIMNYGGSAIPSGNLTEATTDVVDSLSKLQKAFQSLKNTIVQEYGPAFAKFTDAITSITNWITEKISKVEGEKDALGNIKDRVSIASLTSNEASRYRNFNQEEKDTSDKYTDKTNRVKNLLKSSNPLDWMNALYLSQPEVKDASNIENLGIKQQELTVGNAIKAGFLDPNSDNPIIRELANYSYTNPYTGEVLTGYKAFVEELATNGNAGWNLEDVNRLFNNTKDMSEHEILLAMRNFVKLNPKAKDAFSKAFGKGGAFDFGTSLDTGTYSDIIKYLYSTSMLGSPEEQFRAFQVLAKESHKVLDNQVNLEVEHKDRDANGKVDAGEIELTVVVKDQYNNETRKTINIADFI